MKKAGGKGNQTELDTKGRKCASAPMTFQPARISINKHNVDFRLGPKSDHDCGFSFNRFQDISCKHKICQIAPN